MIIKQKQQLRFAMAFVETGERERKGMYIFGHMHVCVYICMWRAV